LIKGLVDVAKKLPEVALTQAEKVLIITITEIAG
jgi:hypothetical protein